MAKRSRNSIDDANEATSGKWSITPVSFDMSVKTKFVYLGNKTVNIYSSCDFGSSEDQHSSPSQSPVKGGAVQIHFDYQASRQD